MWDCISLIFQCNKYSQFGITEQILLLTQQRELLLLLLIKRERRRGNNNNNNNNNSKEPFLKRYTFMVESNCLVFLGQKMSIKLTRIKYDLDPVFDIMPRTYIISALIQSIFFKISFLSTCFFSFFLFNGKLSMQFIL